jgi:hypothetical protein
MHEEKQIGRILDLFLLKFDEAVKNVTKVVKFDCRQIITFEHLFNVSVQTDFHGLPYY